MSNLHRANILIGKFQLELQQQYAALATAAEAVDAAIATGVREDIWRTVAALCDAEYNLTSDCETFGPLSEQYEIPDSFPREGKSETQEEITARTMQSSAACSGYSQQERVTETVDTPDGLDPIIIERIELVTDRRRVVKTLRPDIDSPLTNGVSVKWSEITCVAPEPDLSVRSTTPDATGASVSMATGHSWLDIATCEVLVNHIIATRSALRQLSEELECNEWPDELHLADVVEKHIGRSAAVQDYRERNTKSASEW